MKYYIELINSDGVYTGESEELSEGEVESAKNAIKRVYNDEAYWLELNLKSGGTAFFVSEILKKSTIILKKEV